MQARWVSFLLLVLGGCVTNPPAPSVGLPLPIVAVLQEEALQEERPPDIRVAQRQFATAVDDFMTDVRRLLEGGAPPGDEDMARILDRFAQVLVSTPSTREVDVAATEAEMRVSANRMRSAGPRDAPAVREAFERGLRLGVEALLALARGPYRGVTNVEERARELEAAFKPAGTTEAPPHYAGELEVLRRSGFVMKAILEARDLPPAQ